MNNDQDNNRTGWESDWSDRYVPYQEMTPDITEDNQKANILCAISLACELLPIIAGAIFMSLISSINVSDTPSGWDLLMDIMGSIGSLAMIAGLIIMIYVRVKYPKNIFGKVLMWLFIVGAIIAVLMFIVYAIFLAVACYSCFSCISEFR